MRKVKVKDRFEKSRGRGQRMAPDREDRRKNTRKRKTTRKKYIKAYKGKGTVEKYNTGRQV